MSTKENVDITIPSPIQRVLDKTRELQKEIKEVGQGSIKEMFEAIFKQAPAVLAVKWTQYTPHFNDGEPCVFNVNEPTAVDAAALAVVVDTSESTPAPRATTVASAMRLRSVFVDIYFLSLVRLGLS